MSLSDEEDYLSDKFLVDAIAASSSSQPKTYAQRRQEALKQSRIKNEQNRIKSRRQREQESREEGLSKSLFERAEEDKDGENKALGIMMKMGFKMGHSLGDTGDNRPKEAVEVGAGPSSDSSDVESKASTLFPEVAGPSKTQHKVEPLPLHEWAGKKGIGLGKRTRSPGASDRIAKMAKMAEETSQTDFRDRTRREYEEKRAEARLAPAQQTCVNLDEKAGISFNVLCLDPKNVDTIPKALMDALSDYTRLVSPLALGGSDEASRLRNQMRAEALQPIGSDDDDDALVDTNASQVQQDEFSPETVEEAAYFLRLGPRDRLSLLLSYLRDKYQYCFWCGTQYQDESDMAQNCPGLEEDDHD